MFKNSFLFTFVIPSFNAEKHLNTSLPTLLNQRLKDADVLKFYEIIIVNDGSTDKTLEVAKKYKETWNAIQPNIVKIIDKKNGQYGSAINESLKIAQGRFFKVLDADDWFSINSLIDLIFFTHGLEKQVDVIFTNHVYEKMSTNKRIENSLKSQFESNKILSIEKIKFPSDLITMHSIIYRTQLLLDIKYKQLEKYFYTDSQYSLIPLLSAENMIYINIPLYSYYIGRDDQSININVMVKNRIHQLRVLEKLLEEIDIEEIKYKSVKKYVFTCLRRFLQWQFMLIILDENIPKNKKYKEIRKIVIHIKNIQKNNNNKILSGLFFTLIKYTRGHGAKFFLRIGIIVYSKYRLNILDNW